jgi:acyl-CoA dehydrogenase
MNVDLPFFDDTHRRLAVDLAFWCSVNVPQDEPEDVDQRGREMIASLGEAGWLRYCVPAAYGGALPQVDLRSLCVARATLAYHSGLADLAFAAQGLGSGALALY